MGLDFDKIKTAREKKKWTQAEAATAAGLGSAQRWNDIESGRRTNITLETLEAIAKALGVSAKSLLSEGK